MEPEYRRIMNIYGEFKRVTASEDDAQCRARFDLFVDRMCKDSNLDREQIPRLS